MAVDAGILQGMAGGFTNWDRVRADDERALQFRREAANIHEKQLHDSLAAGAKTQEYLDAISKASLLDPDLKRVRAKELDLRSTIADGIKKFGGDVDSYLNSGGLTELHNYLKDLTNSDEMKRGLSNYANHTMYTQDVKAGLNPRNVTWNGKAGSYRDQYDDYANGKTDTLNYNGGYERPAINLREEFGKVYGNQHKTPQAAHAYDVYNMVYTAAKSKGLSDADAHQEANDKTSQYTMSLKDKEFAPYWYKSEDPSIALGINLHNALMAKKLHAGDEPQGDSWLPSVMHGELAKHPDQTNIHDNGFRTTEYNVGVDRSNNLNNVAGVDIETEPKLDKDGNVIREAGFVKNPSALLNSNDLHIYGTNTPLDLKGLKPEWIESIKPLQRVIKTYDPNGNLVNAGNKYEIKLTPEGRKAAQVAHNSIGEGTPQATFGGASWLNHLTLGALGRGDNATITVVKPIVDASGNLSAATIKDANTTNKETPGTKTGEDMEYQISNPDVNYQEYFNSLQNQ